MNIIWFKDCSYKNKHLVGGKNASLGELYHLSKTLNFKIANGFAITTDLYNKFIENNKLNNLVEEAMNSVNVDDIEELNNKSEYIKDLFNNALFTEDQINEILNQIFF